MLSCLLERFWEIDRCLLFGVDVAAYLGSEFMNPGLAAVTGILIVGLMGPAERGRPYGYGMGVELALGV